jgi:hypothetical protein
LGWFGKDALQDGVDLEHEGGVFRDAVFDRVVTESAGDAAHFVDDFEKSSDLRERNDVGRILDQTIKGTFNNLESFAIEVPLVSSDRSLPEIPIGRSEFRDLWFVRWKKFLHRVSGLHRRRPREIGKEMVK